MSKSQLQPVTNAAAAGGKMIATYSVIQLPEHVQYCRYKQE
jgi:hypothetical protein